MTNEKVLKQNLASKKFLCAVQKIINYGFENEQKHYNELEKNEDGKWVKSKDHIFKQYKYAQKYLKNFSNKEDK